jgi:very-short-patch-repair endonuclease
MANKTPYDWIQIQKEYDSGKSLRELGPNLNTLAKAKKRGWFTPRSLSESGLIRAVTKPLVHSKETKEKLREHMIRRLEEGTYPTLGRNFKGRPQSYPERWMESVIKTRFNDQSYITEYGIGIYSLDFAWPEIKKCIEVDGATHELTVDKDAKRDKWLTEQGWQTLRIEWKKCVKDKEIYIIQAKEFIDGE